MKDHRFVFAALCVCILASVGVSAEKDLSRYYGFEPIEVVKVDYGIHSLNICDFNADGINDIALVNNRRSRLELYLRRDHDDINRPPAAESDNINELQIPGQFDKQEILLTVKLGSLVCGDFNHDGRPDLAGYGQPAGLYIFYQDEPTNTTPLVFKAAVKVPVKQGLFSAHALAVGDLNQDNKDDMLLAGENQLYLLYQPDTPGDFKPTETASAGSIQSVRIADFNQDSKNDIIVLTKDLTSPLHIRYGLNGGAFSPVYQYQLQSLLDYEIVDDAPMLFYVEKVSGRLTLAAPDNSPQTSDVDLNVLTFPLSKSGKSSNRDMTLADVDGNGLKDVIISFPDDAKVQLYLQTTSGLSEPKSFPSLSEIAVMQTADVNQDGTDEIIVLSDKERTIGVSHYHKGRLTFPDPLNTEIAPVAMSVSTLCQSCIYIGKDSDKDLYKLYSVMYNPAADAKPNLLIKEIEGLDSDPRGMKLQDVDQNGLEDVIIFRGYNEPLVYLQTSAYQFEPVKKQGSQSGLIQSATIGNMTSGAMDSKSNEHVLLAQKNFARLLTYDKKQWKVLDQFNAAASGDQIASAGMFDLDGDNVSEVVLFDKKNWQLQILKQDDTQTYQPDRQIPVGKWDISGQFKLLYESLMGTGDKQLILFDGAKFAAIPQSQQSDDFPTKLSSVLSWETTIRNGRYVHFVTGDINSDDQLDIVLVEPRKNQMDILTCDRSGDKPRLIQGTQFRIFEEKTFKQERSMASAEPREMLIADVTGEGANDLVTIMHDRIVIYPQDN